MTDYYVDWQKGDDGATGTGAAPFKTPHRALKVVTAGDRVLLRGNDHDATTFFPKPLQINKSFTTWMADEGHRPTFDGDYYPTDDKPASFALGKSVPGSLYAKMVTVRTAGVTVRGLRVQHIGGGGIGVGRGADKTVIDSCIVDTTYGASLDVGGDSQNEKIAGIEIRNCVFTNSSLAFRAPGQGQKAANGVMLKFVDQVKFIGNVVSRCYKEGLNVDKACFDVVVADCLFDTTNHACIYINRAAEVIIRGNLIYHRRDERFLNPAADVTPTPVGIKIGDEGKPGSKAGQYPNSRRQRVLYNIVIGGSSCLTVANNPNNYDTCLDGAEIAYNTFIGERWLRDGKVASTGAVIEIFQNVNGRPHRNSTFHSNVIYAPRGVRLGKLSGVGGIEFSNNCWYSFDGEAPPVRGERDVTANPLLINPEADIPAEGPIVLLNYRPEANSPLVGEGTDGRVIGALEPATPPPPPPPDGVDLDAVANLAGAACREIEAASEELAVVEGLVDGIMRRQIVARDELQRLIDLINEVQV